MQIYNKALLLCGVKESALFNNVVNIINVLTISFIVILGSTKSDVNNWKIQVQVSFER
jgi:hypothetical protein